MFFFLTVFDAVAVKVATPVVVNEKTYHLNKSKSKFVTVGLAYDFGFQPCITFSGNKSKTLLLSEYEWKELLQYQGLLTNYFYTQEVTAPLTTSALTISFENYNDVKYIKLEDRHNSYVCFGIESVCQLWMLLPLIEYRLDMLRKQDFQNYFNCKLNIAVNKNGDIYQQIINVISAASNPDSENVSTMMELLFQHPNLPDFVQKCNFTYNGVWM